MCLRAQVIDDCKSGVGRGRQARGLSNDDRGVGGARGIYNVSEGLETRAEAARIRGKQRRLWRRNDGPEELATATEVLEEEYEPEDSTTTTESSAEEV